MLKTAEKVFSCDIDKSALSKLWFLTPHPLRKNLAIKPLNITERFPFPNNFFAGIFCTGILHLFPKEILLGHIFPEFKRVLKKRGRIIFDFATDIKRVYPDGKLHLSYPNEPHYEFGESLNLFKKFASRHKILKVIKSSVHDDLTKTPGLGYKFSCGFFLMDIKKVGLDKTI